MFCCALHDGGEKPNNIKKEGGFRRVLYLRYAGQYNKMDATRRTKTMRREAMTMDAWDTGTNNMEWRECGKTNEERHTRAT